MDKMYTAYKIVFSDGQFPLYRSTYSTANATAGMQAKWTKTSIDLYGFVRGTGEIRFIKTYGMKKSRT